MSPAEPDRTARFESLLERHRDAVWRVTAGYAQTEADRKDLFQDIAIAIWQAVPSFRGDSSMRTFIYRIAHNQGLSHKRYERRRTHDDIASLAVPDPAPGPLEATEESELRDRLLAAVRRLKPQYRQPLMLHLEGLSNGEIAEVLGISAGNVAVRLTRARSQVEGILKGARDDG